MKGGVIKLVKCTGTQNVADTLTNSVPFPTLEKHYSCLWGSGMPFSAFWLGFSGLGEYEQEVEAVVYRNGLCPRW